MCKYGNDAPHRSSLEAPPSLPLPLLRLPLLDLAEVPSVCSGAPSLSLLPLLSLSELRVVPPPCSDAPHSVVRWQFPATACSSAAVSWVWNRKQESKGQGRRRKGLRRKEQGRGRDRSRRREQESERETRDLLFELRPLGD